MSISRMLPLESSVVKLLPGDKWLLFGLANDEIGYIIPKRQWDEQPPFAYGRDSGPVRRDQQRRSRSRADHHAHAREPHSRHVGGDSRRRPFADAAHSRHRGRETPPTDAEHRGWL